MSESFPPHEFQNPQLADLYAFFATVQKVSGDTEARNGIISACKQTWRGEKPVDRLFKLQDSCAWAAKRIATIKAAPRTKQIYQDHLDRAREMLLAIQSSSKWSDFQVRANHLPDELIRLDDFLGPDCVDQTAAERLTKTSISEIAVLRNSIAKDTDLPTELRELLLGQLGLLERSVSRFTSMGFSSFQEVIELSYGKLSIVLAHSQQPQTLKRMRQLLEFLIKLHSGAELARGGVALLEHIPIRAIAPPRDTE